MTSNCRPSRGGRRGPPVAAPERQNERAEGATEAPGDRVRSGADGLFRRDETGIEMAHEGVVVNLALGQQPQSRGFFAHRRRDFTRGEEIIRRHPRHFGRQGEGRRGDQAGAIERGGGREVEWVERSRHGVLGDSATIIRAIGRNRRPTASRLLSPQHEQGAIDQEQAGKHKGQSRPVGSSESRDRRREDQHLEQHPGRGGQRHPGPW